MNREDRERITRLLQQHGYPQCTDDPRVARVAGKGRFEEHVAVHPENSVYTLYVRRGGRAYLEDVAAQVGGSLEGPVLAIRNLDDIRALDIVLTRVLASLERHPK